MKQQNDNIENKLLMLGNNIASDIIKLLFRGGNGTTLEDAWQYMEEEFKEEYIKEITQIINEHLLRLKKL